MSIFIFTCTGYAGGRTECATLYCELSEEDVSKGWSIEYLDVVSCNKVNMTIRNASNPITDEPLPIRSD